METRLRVNFTNPTTGISESGFLTVKNDSEFVLNLSLVDIRDISKRKGTYSKTVTLIGDKETNRLMGYLFDVNAEYNTFSPLRRNLCDILVDGATLKGDCWLRLLNIKKVEKYAANQLVDAVEYEVQVMDSTGEFFGAVGDKLVEELSSFSAALTHNYNNAMLKANVEGAGTYFGDYRDIYRYITPWINRSGIPFWYNTYSMNELIPSLYAKTVFEMIHQEAGFRCHFHNQFGADIRFDRLLLPHRGNNLLESVAEDYKVVVQRGPLQSYTSTSIINTFAGQRMITNPPAIKDKYNQYSFANLEFNNAISTMSYNQNIVTPNSYTRVTVEFDFTLWLTNLSGGSAWSGEILYMPCVKLNTISGTAITASVYNDLDYTPANNGWIGPGTPFLNNNINNIGTQYIVDNPPGKGWTTASIVELLPSPVSQPIIKNAKFRVDIDVTHLNSNEGIVLFIDVEGNRSTTSNIVMWKNSPSSTTPVSVRSKLDVSNLKVTFKQGTEPSSRVWTKWGGTPQQITVNPANSIPVNANVNPQIFLPRNLKQADFLKAINLIYNLHAEPDLVDPTMIHYWIRDQYYDVNHGAKMLDWTEKLCKDIDQTITPVAEISAKELTLTYAQNDDDPFMKAYKEQVTETFAQNKTIFTSENVRGEEVKSMVFAPTASNYTSYNRVQPVIGNDTKPRILFEGDLVQDGGSVLFGIHDGISSTFVRQQRLVGMYDKPENPLFSIFFGDPRYTLYNAGANLITNTLVNRYWRTTLQQMDNGKLFTAYFNLTKLDAHNLSLRDNIKVNNTYWVINRMIDYRVNKQQFTQVELINAVSPFDLSDIPLVPSNPTPPSFLSPAAAAKVYDDLYYASISGANTIGKGAVSSSVQGTGNVIPENFRGFVAGSGKAVQENGFHTATTVMNESGLGAESKLALGKISATGNITTRGLIWSAGEVLPDGAYVLEPVSSSGVGTGARVTILQDGDTTEIYCAIDGDGWENTGGADYKVGEILSFEDGTFTFSLEVVAVQSVISGIELGERLRLANIPVYTDTASAIADGLKADTVYKTPDGILRII